MGHHPVFSRHFGTHRTNMPRLTTPSIVHLNDFRGLGFESSTLRMRAGHSSPHCLRHATERSLRYSAELEAME